MKYFYINERVFSIGDKFDIYDENGNVAYFAKGRIFSFGKQYDIYDKSNSEVAFIKQQVFRFLPRYDLYINGEIVATIKKKFTFFYSEYDIDSQYGNFTIDGDMMAWNFNIQKDGETQCLVHKSFDLFKDKYQIEIQDDVNEIFALSLVIILDSIHHEPSATNHH